MTGDSKMGKVIHLRTYCVRVINHLLSASVDAVPEDDLSLRVGQVPDARGAVPRPGGEQVLHRVPRADEDLLVVALEHARLLLRDLHPLVDRQLKQVEYST